MDQECETGTRKKSLAVSKACVAMFWLPPGFKGRTFVNAGFSTERTSISASTVRQWDTIDQITSDQFTVTITRLVDANSYSTGTRQRTQVKLFVTEQAWVSYFSQRAMRNCFSSDQCTLKIGRRLHTHTHTHSHTHTHTHTHTLTHTYTHTQTKQRMYHKCRNLAKQKTAGWRSMRGYILIYSRL